MACNTNSSIFNIPAPGPAPTLPGLQSPISVPKNPYADVFDGYSTIDSIEEIISKLTTIFPNSTTIIPNTDTVAKNMWSGLANLMTQLSPYLAFYKFLQPLLNVIIGIIDVICALLNPFALFDAITKLFKKYIPEFLSMFPQTALLVVMIALLLLLIQIIEYMITYIGSIVQQIVENVAKIQQASQRNDSAGILSGTKKISYLLCSFQNLMSLLTLFQGVFAIIQPLLLLVGEGLCDSNSGCCGADYCPPFIQQNSNSQFSYTTGILRYYPQIQAVLPSSSDFDFLRSSPPILRNESWQFYDGNQNTYNFADVITPSPKGFIFWHNNDTYDESIPLVKIPYTVDMTLQSNPAVFGIPDTKGFRTFVIKSCIVRSKPTLYVNQYNNTTANYLTGVVSIEGGLVFESDGSTSFNIGSTQATLDDFIHFSTEYATFLPGSDDGYYFNNVSYNFNWNPPALVEQQLITMMCQGAPAQEAVVANANLDTRSILDKIGIPPDVATAIGDLNVCFSNFQSNINADTAAQFQTCTTSILNQLQNDCTSFICNGIIQSADRFQSQAALYPDLQFIDQTIDVSVVLKDKTGSLLAQNVTVDIGVCVAQALSAKITLGSISPFVYDGYGAFNGQISTTIAGTGNAVVYMNNQSLASVLNLDNFNVPTSISENTFNYEFISQESIERRTVVSEESGGKNIRFELEV